MMTMCAEKSWLEAEMKRTTDLLRLKVEQMNDMQVSSVDGDDLEDFKNLYRTLHFIQCLSENLEVEKTIAGNACNSWLHTEMYESMTLLRKKISIMNSKSVEDLNNAELINFKNAYKALYFIFSIGKDKPKTE